MPHVFLRLTILLACSAFVACTSMNTLVDTSAAQGESMAAIQPLLAPNDALTVTTRTGPATRIHLTTSAPDYLEGTLDDDKQLRRFQLADVVKIERREFNGVKTAFLVIGIAAGVFAIGNAAAQASLMSGL